VSRDESDDDLLAAYLDGVAELTPDERRRVEARLAEDPALRDDAGATRALLDQLRDLPPEGAEPDWRALEQAIRAEVGDDVPRRSWLARHLAWIAPGFALALAAAVLALVLRTPEPTPIAPVVPDAGVARAVAPGPAAEPASEADGTVALWLDGAPLEIAVADADRIDEGDLATALEVTTGLDVGVDVDVEVTTGVGLGEADALTAELAPTGAELLTPGDLAWIDELGEDDLAAAELWLARKKS